MYLCHRDFISCLYHWYCENKTIHYYFLQNTIKLYSYKKDTWTKRCKGKDLNFYVLYHCKFKVQTTRTLQFLEEPLKETFIKEKAIQKYECHRHYLEDDNKCDPRSFKRLWWIGKVILPLFIVMSLLLESYYLCRRIPTICAKNKTMYLVNDNLIWLELHYFFTKVILHT